MTADRPPPPLHGGGYLGPWDLVPVTFEGGPLDGEVNDQDYTENENREQVGETWDYTPASVDSTADDVIERYRLDWRDGRWFYVHVGTFERPVEDRNFDAVFVGGPRGGERTTFVGNMRQRPEHATSLYPGYVLRHVGDDPATGWEMRPINSEGA